MKQSTQHLIDRITKEEPAIQGEEGRTQGAERLAQSVKSKANGADSEEQSGNRVQNAADSSQLAGNAVLSVESKSAESKATTRQRTLYNGRTDQMQNAKRRRQSDNGRQTTGLQTKSKGSGAKSEVEGEETLSAMRSALSDFRAVRGLEKKIRDRSAKVGVIGLGYVGLALALEMAKAGFQVTGIDVDKEKVESINAGISYNPDVTNEALLSLVASDRLKATESVAVMGDFDAVSICVPTPLRKTKEPDLSFVVAAVETVRNHLRPGQLIILESTTYPGTTQELILPTLEKTGLKVGKDFFLAFSPERIDPGNRKFTTSNIPKVVGGVTPHCTELAALLYGQFIEKIVPVSSPACAEMVKLLENTFRNVNIALANEIALVCHKLGIKAWEVIEAAKTKPFGFMSFQPGPGLGGHCIPVDPYYLTWKAKMNGIEPRLIEVATSINSQMPGFTISRIADALNEREKSLKGSTILALGIAYKRDTADIRESPAIEVMQGLYQKGALVQYSDPYVRCVQVNGQVMRSLNLSPGLLRSMDCAVILTDHSSFDYAMISTHSRLVLDCRNVLKEFKSQNIISL